jgi:excinuclease ABC subunit C
VNNETPQPVFDVKAFLKTLTTRPGIYKMLDERGEIIYIGKAKNLKNRVSSYFRSHNVSPKQQAMVARVANIEVMVTHTEGEALLLESQQIKRFKPRYNICLRDDKSYPYVFLSDHKFPQLTFHRGAKKRKGLYFGPYPSAGAVRETLKLLQKIFPVRQCEDSFYKHRTRPCLQYQIQRCTAPCTQLISEEDYRRDVENTKLFLQGKGNQVIDNLVQRMEHASEQLAFEQAAVYRDQIARLRSVLEKHFVLGEKGDVDVVAVASRGGSACVQVFFIRKGQNLGSKTFFPKMSDAHSPGDILQAFIAQYYLERQVPNELIVSHVLPEADLLSEMLSKQARQTVTISPNVRGQRAKWLEMAANNADNSLAGRLADKQGIYQRFLSLQEELGLDEMPTRLECFDISHTQGDQTVASCVVYTLEGPLTAAYRRFNIEGITPGDDYAAIYQAVYRRFKRMKKGEHPEPDILLIDGGQGQVAEAQKALAELAVNNVMIVGVSKGPDRKAGMEKIILPGQAMPVDVKSGSAALLLIQHIRDEAHRFAITGHRARRAKNKRRSVLEDIPGLGPKRRQSLLKQFGGLQGVARAGVEALSSVEGISRHLAQKIYDSFHQ